MNFWHIKIPQNCLCNWRKLLRLRDYVRLFFFHKIGDGRGTSLWYENWHLLGPLVINWGSHIIAESRLPKTALVCNIWNGSKWCWPNNSSHELLEIQIFMSNIVPNRSLGDMIRWTPSSSGIYSAASAWDKFRQSKPTVGWSKLVWYNQNIPKISFILWLAIKCKLSTMDRILTFAPSVPVTCVLCTSDTESHCHLFFECPFTDGIWSSVLFKCGVPWLRLPWPLFVTWATSRCKGKSLSSIVLKLSLVVIVYYVWREWNNRRFKNSRQPAAMVLNSVKSTIRLRLSSLKIAHSTANDSTLREWNITMNS